MAGHSAAIASILLIPIVASREVTRSAATLSSVASVIKLLGEGTRCSKSSMFFRGEKYVSPSHSSSYYFGTDFVTVVGGWNAGVYVYDRVICYDGKSNAVQIGMHKSTALREQSITPHVLEERRRFVWFIQESELLHAYALLPDEWSLLSSEHQLISLEKKPLDSAKDYLEDGVVLRDSNFRRIVVVPVLRAEQISDASFEASADAAVDASDLTTSATTMTYRPWWAATIRGEAKVFGVALLSGGAGGHLPDFEIRIDDLRNNDKGFLCFVFFGPSSFDKRRHMLCKESRVGHRVTLSVTCDVRIALSLRSLWILEMENPFDHGRSAHGKLLKDTADSANATTRIGAERTALTEEWSRWSACTTSCGGGVQRRLRPCVYEQCRGSNAETKPCSSLPVCAVASGNWGAWRGWSACSASCGRGHQSRARPCFAALSSKAAAYYLSYDLSNAGAPDITRSVGVARERKPAVSGSSDCGENDVEFKTCTEEPCSHGTWAEWTSWGPCSAAPGCGYRIRTSPCTDRAGRCPRRAAPWFETEACVCRSRGSDAELPGSLNDSAAGSSTCSRRCGLATAIRVACASSLCQEVSAGGKPCPLKFDPCPGELVEPGWGLSVWTEWSRCSISCAAAGSLRSAISTRRRECLFYNCGVAEQEQVKACSRLPGCESAASGVAWSSWLEWTQCSVTCGEGTRMRSRTCVLPPGGASSGSSPTASCGGPSMLFNECFRDPCRARLDADAEWYQWEQWSGCRSAHGHEHRSRECRASPCKGEHFEMRSCLEEKRRPVAGSSGSKRWLAWSQWSECRGNCYGALGASWRWRQSECESAATCSGAKCSDATCDVSKESEQRPCGEVSACPVDGAWFPWSSWDRCQPGCPRGSRARRRQCDQPKYGGLPCEGPAVESGTCDVVPGWCAGEWQPWLTWSGCSKSCGGGERTRQRFCGLETVIYDCLNGSSQVAKCGPDNCMTTVDWAEFDDFGNKIVETINNASTPVTVWDEMLLGVEAVLTMMKDNVVASSVLAAIAVFVVVAMAVLITKLRRWRQSEDWATRAAAKNGTPREVAPQETRPLLPLALRGVEPPESQPVLAGESTEAGRASPTDRTMSAASTPPTGGRRAAAFDRPQRQGCDPTSAATVALRRQTASDCAGAFGKAEADFGQARPIRTAPLAPTSTVATRPRKSVSPRAMPVAGRFSHSVATPIPLGLPSASRAAQTPRYPPGPGGTPPLPFPFAGVVRRPQIPRRSPRPSPAMRTALHPPGPSCAPQIRFRQWSASGAVRVSVPDRGQSGTPKVRGLPPSSSLKRAARLHPWGHRGAGRLHSAQRTPALEGGILPFP